jgi:uncharacterized protein (DUF488 family)
MLFTIGHSNHSVKSFINILHLNFIEYVIDVRSAPFSRHVPHFNKPDLVISLQAEGLHYMHMGKELGGFPQDRSLYTAEGLVDYDRLAAIASFQKGLDRITKGIQKGFRIVLMCAEENPQKCHRHFLLAKEFAERRKIAVSHLRADGTITLANSLPFISQQQQLFTR